MPHHLTALVFLTIGLSVLVALPNGPALSGTVPPSLGRVAMMFVYPAVFGAVMLMAWLFVRKSRWGFASVTASKSTEASTSESPRRLGIACFSFAAVFVLIGVVGLFAKEGRLSMVNWLLGRVRWERDALIVSELGVTTWGIAFASLGVHYFTGRCRWLAHLSLLQAIVGWLLLVLAVWMQRSHLEGLPCNT